MHQIHRFRRIPWHAAVSDPEKANPKQTLLSARHGLSAGWSVCFFDIAYAAMPAGRIRPAPLGVATFYAQFRLKPVGKNLIMLCQGTACHVNGSQLIEEAITEHLGIHDGETTEDNLFTLNNVACLGCCSLAPVMMVKNAEGDETYGNLTKTKVKQILDEIRERA